MVILSHRTLFATAILATLSTLPAAAQAPVGVLECNVSASTGAIVTSTKALSCVFRPSNGAPPELYSGAINTLGFDVGFTGPGRLTWGVAIGGSYPGPYPLAGTYTGATAGLTILAGADANTLVGGNGNTVSLQPLSVSAQTGLDITAGIGTLTLTPVPPAPHAAHKHH